MQNLSNNEKMKIMDRRKLICEVRRKTFIRGQNIDPQEYVLQKLQTTHFLEHVSLLRQKKQYTQPKSIYSANGNRIMTIMCIVGGNKYAKFVEKRKNEYKG